MDVVAAVGAGVVGAVAAGGLVAAPAPAVSKGSSAKTIGADGSGGRRGIGGSGWPFGPNAPGVGDASGVAAVASGGAPGTSDPMIGIVSTVGGCGGATSGVIDASGGVGSGSASGSMGAVGAGMANGGGSVGPVGASVIVGSGFAAGSGAEVAGGGGFDLSAARCPCEACRLLAMTMVVARAAASDPAMVGVSSGVGAYFGPSAERAAKSAASMNRPRAKLMRTVVPGLIPATNTRNATQKATLTISVNDTIKARIDLPRTRYSQPTHLLILLDITSWARRAMSLRGWWQKPKITVG
jgi:hypothetical protein